MSAECGLTLRIGTCQTVELSRSGLESLSELRHRREVNRGRDAERVADCKRVCGRGKDAVLCFTWHIENSCGALKIASLAREGKHLPQTNARSWRKEFAC